MLAPVAVNLNFFRLLMTIRHIIFKENANVFRVKIKSTSGHGIQRSGRNENDGNDLRCGTKALCKIDNRQWFYRFFSLTDIHIKKANIQKLWLQAVQYRLLIIGDVDIGLPIVYAPADNPLGALTTRRKNK